MYFARPTIAIAKIRDYSQSSRVLARTFERHDEFDINKLRLLDGLRSPSRVLKEFFFRGKGFQGRASFLIANFNILFHQIIDYVVKIIAYFFQNFQRIVSCTYVKLAFKFTNIRTHAMPHANIVDKNLEICFETQQFTFKT